MKTGEDFKEQAKLLNIDHWDSHKCAICNYMTKFVFVGGQVLFDSGCDCMRELADYSPRTWDDVADYYNMQINASVKKEFSKFWRFEE